MAMKLICMSFDGEYVNEGEFDSVDEAWEHDGEMGSRWIFYPFHFVLTESGKTIKAAPDELDRYVGKRLSTVKSIFAKTFVDYSEEVDIDGLLYAQLLNNTR